MALRIEMEPGDVLFHCLSAPHGSAGNPTDTTRRIFYIHYMCQSVMQECYPDWIASTKTDRGWHDGGFDLVESMLAARRESPYPHDLSVANIHYTRGIGFEYTGQPGTPRHHWGTLINQMSPEEIAAKKALTYMS